MKRNQGEHPDAEFQSLMCHYFKCKKMREQSSESSSYTNIDGEKGRYCDFTSPTHSSFQNQEHLLQIQEHSAGLKFGEPTPGCHRLMPTTVSAGILPDNMCQNLNEHCSEQMKSPQTVEAGVEENIDNGFISNFYSHLPSHGLYPFAPPEYLSLNGAAIVSSQNESNMSLLFSQRNNMEASCTISPKRFDDCELSGRVNKPVTVENTGRGIFQFEPDRENLSIADRYLLIEKQQCMELSCITVPEKVAYVYNPLEYAFEPHYNFIQRFCNSTKSILFLGMNPGPWGMSQNGVPFGENKMVKDWLCVTGRVLKPFREHPKRPVCGMNCKRSEVSGSRFWSLFQEMCGSPERFFANCFVYNLCPLAFMSESGKNVTVPQMDSATRQKVNSICERSLLQVLELLNISTIVGVGKFAYNQARKILTSANINSIRVESIMHPSPINPAANRGWNTIAQQQLQQLDLFSIISQRQELLRNGVQCDSEH